jgi:hypothetical protein
VLTADDEGSTISVRVTRAGYKDSVTSDPTAAVTADDRDPLTGTVTIGATAEVDQTLTAVTDLQGSGTVFYQWLANGQPIFGATESSYTVVEADIGKTISVRVTRADNSGSVTSNSTVAVPEPPPVTGTPNSTIGFNYGAITFTVKN